MELIVMLILIAAVGALILWPLMSRTGRSAEPSRPEPRSGEGPLSSSKSRAALSAIKELEFDFATGKLAEDDYRMLRARYEVKALDALNERPATTPGSTPSTEDALEAEIRAARGRRFCASCGARLPAAARFCPSCGAAAEVPA